MECRRSLLSIREAFILAYFLVVTLAAGTVGRAAQKPDANNKIKQLLEKRATVRAEILKIVTEAYKVGQASYAQVQEAQASLLAAKLDLCETKEQRIEMHREMIATAERSLTLVQQLFQSGQGSKVEVLKADDYLLEARIGLEKVMASN